MNFDDFKFLVVSGGRDYVFSELDKRALEYIFTKDQYSAIMTGGATGADACAERWAHAKGIPFFVFPADWDQYGNSAGPIRNRSMAELGHGVLFYPGGKGTENMIKCAQDQFLVTYFANDIKKQLRTNEND